MDPTSTYRDAERLFNDRRYEEAFKAYKDLAAGGDPNCQVFLGWMYHEGLGVEKSEEQALRWFRGAANLGSKIGAFYCGKHALIHERFDEALKWLHESAKQEYGPALLWLGLAHMRGLGVRVDFDKGVGYLRRSAAAGNFPAKRELAVLMIRGKLGLAKVPLGILLFPSVLVVALVDAVLRGSRSDRFMG